MACHEDRDLIDRVMRAGMRPVRLQNAVVRASMRPDGRAPGGMAEKIAQRLAGIGVTLDSALTPVAALWASGAGQRKSFGGELTHEQAVRELPVLASHVARLKRMSCPSARRRYLEQVQAP